MNAYKKKCDYNIKKFFDVFFKNDYEKIKSFTTDHGGMDAVDEYGRTVLINCIIEGKSSTQGNEFAQKLIQDGANPLSKDNSGWTALHFAIQNKNMEIIDILLSYDKGVDVKSKPNYLMLALNNHPQEQKLLIRLMELGVDPFEKEDKNKYSPYELMTKFQNGEIMIGSTKIDMTIVLEYIATQRRFAR